jgi:hypothetical protein
MRRGRPSSRSPNLSKEVREQFKELKGQMAKAKQVGKLAAQKAIGTKGITQRCVRQERLPLPRCGEGDGRRRARGRAEILKRSPLSGRTLTPQAFVGSSNGRTAAFGAVSRGSTPLPTATRSNRVNSTLMKERLTTVARIKASELELKDRLVHINRVAKVVKGGTAVQLQRDRRRRRRQGACRHRPGEGERGGRRDLQRC